jgi:hypothetical protein
VYKAIWGEDHVLHSFHRDLPYLHSVSGLQVMDWVAMVVPEQYWQCESKDQ